MALTDINWKITLAAQKWLSLPHNLFYEWIQQTNVQTFYYELVKCISVYEIDEIVWKGGFSLFTSVCKTFHYICKLLQYIITIIVSIWCKCYVNTLFPLHCGNIAFMLSTTIKNAVNTAVLGNNIHIFLIIWSIWINSMMFS